MSDFTWIPSASPAPILEEEPRVLSAKFGDGYEQRAGDGINNRPQVWTVHFNNRSLAQANAIIAFLRARNGASSFTWTPPDGSAEIRVICRKWPMAFADGYPKRYRSFSLTFEQVFGS